jgi:hypothetical protein
MPRQHGLRQPRLVKVQHLDAIQDQPTRHAAVIRIDEGRRARPKLAFCSYFSPVRRRGVTPLYTPGTIASHGISIGSRGGSPSRRALARSGLRAVFAAGSP